MDKQSTILTIITDPASHQYFTSLRNQYFPKHCNYLEAHLTLFHKLPVHNDFIDRTLLEISNREKLIVEVSAIKSIGNGVAFEIKSEELKALHKTLQSKFTAWLINQDRQKIWPHITVQNKVTAYKAQQTLLELQKDFKPFAIEAIGIESWLYLGGPWQSQQQYLFTK